MLAHIQKYHNTMDIHSANHAMMWALIERDIIIALIEDCETNDIAPLGVCTQLKEVNAAIDLLNNRGDLNAE